MRTVRVSNTGGRYSKGIISSGVFTPEQLRYLDGELEKIVAVIASHDEELVNLRDLEMLDGLEMWDYLRMR